MQTDSSTGEGSSSRKTKSQYMTSKPLETSPLLGRNGALDYDSTYSKRKDKFRARSSRNDQHDNSLEHDRHGNESNARPNFVQELITWGRGRWQLCSVLISLLCISLILVAALLLLTPEYAQRSLEDGMKVNFREASIVNATENGDVSILTLHIVGELLLQNLTYKLAKRTSWLLGDINTRPSHLQIYYIPKTSEQYQQNEQQQLMGTITLPSLTISSRSPITQFSFDTQFVISNAPSLMNFCMDAVASPEVSWKVSGPVELQLGWFSPSINLQRQVTLDGMDGLKEASIQSISFPGAHPLGGISLEGAVAIYNPSSMLSLTLGDVDFGIFLPDSNSTVSDDLMIAVVLAKDAALLGKRHNTFNISGRSLPLDDSNIRGKRLMENFLSTYLRGNDSIVHVRGSPFGPDQDISSQSLSTPKWLQKALQLLTIAVPFPGTKETELIQSLELTNIKIDFSSQGDPLISGDVAALLKKPKEMQFSMNVTSILPHVYLYPQQNSSSPFGQLIPDEPCPATTKEGDGSKDAPFGTLKVLSKIQRAPFRVLPGKDDDFQKFLNEIFYGRGGKVYIRGDAEAQVDSPFGLLNIHDLAFRGEIDTKGMKGLTDPPPEATSISLIRGDPDALHLSCVLLIHNPSDVDINLGQLNVLLEYDSQVIGDATIEEMHLLPERRNEYVAAGRLLINGLPNSPSSSASPMIDFIGDYISGEKNVSLTIFGRHPNATASDLLKLLIHNLEFTVEPPMFEEQPLLEDMQMNILSSTTIMWLCNPFENIVIQLLKLNGTARYESHNIGTAVADFENLEEGWEGPIVLPPLACQTDPCMSFIVETPKIPVMAKKLGFDAIRKALGGEISISVASWLKIKIDQLELEDLRYQRNNLTMKVRKGF